MEIFPSIGFVKGISRAIISEVKIIRKLFRQTNSFLKPISV